MRTQKQEENRLVVFFVLKVVGRADEEEGRVSAVLKIEVVIRYQNFG